MLTDIKKHSPMNGFSQGDITAHPQFAYPVTQQLDRSDLTYSSNQVDSLPANLLLIACLCVAAAFFSIGVRVGRRQTKHYELIVTRIQQIQTLERIWQMKAEHKD